MYVVYFSLYVCSLFKKLHFVFKFIKSYLNFQHLVWDLGSSTKIRCTNSVTNHIWVKRFRDSMLMPNNNIVCAIIIIFITYIPSIKWQKYVVKCDLMREEWIWMDLHSAAIKNGMWMQLILVCKAFERRHFMFDTNAFTNL